MDELKVLVCGGRDYDDRDRVFKILSEIHTKDRRILTLIHGAAQGADSLAEKWAKENEVIYIGVPAQWSMHGKAAGPNRNAFMLKEFKPNLVVAFPGGRGTSDMTSKAKAAGVYVRRV